MLKIIGILCQLLWIISASGLSISPSSPQTILLSRPNNNNNNNNKKEEQGGKLIRLGGCDDDSDDVVIMHEMEKSIQHQQELSRFKHDWWYNGVIKHEIVDNMSNPQQGQKSIPFVSQSCILDGLWPLLFNILLPILIGVIAGSLFVLFAVTISEFILYFFPQ